MTIVLHPNLADAALAEEQAALERAQTDPQAFGPIFDAYYPKIFGYAMRRTGRYEAARDIAAETFLKAVLALPKFQWRDKPIAAWLFRIATNEINQFFRRKKTESRVWDALPSGYVPEQQLQRMFEAEKAEMEAEMEDFEDFLRVQRALKMVDMKYQEVIALRYFEQKSVREIADILDKNEGTVKSLISRGLNKLAALLPDTHE